MCVRDVGLDLKYYLYTKWVMLITESYLHSEGSGNVESLRKDTPVTRIDLFFFGAYTPFPQGAEVD